MDLSSYSFTSCVDSSSSTITALIDTVTEPSSRIVVLAAVSLTVTVLDAVLAEDSVTSSVSPGSTTSSVLVAMVIVPLAAPDVIVRLPPGSS